MSHKLWKIRLRTALEQKAARKIDPEHSKQSQQVTEHRHADWSLGYFKPEQT